jgi:hypothetical protein
MDDIHLKPNTPTKRGHRRQASVGSAYQSEREGLRYTQFTILIYNRKTIRTFFARGFTCA